MKENYTTIWQGDGIKSTIELDRYCPQCFSWEIMINIIKEESVSACTICNWGGKYIDLLTKNEIMNINRTKLIDKILNDN